MCVCVCLLCNVLFSPNFWWDEVRCSRVSYTFFQHLSTVWLPRSCEKQRTLTAKEMLATLGYPCRPQTANQLRTATWQFDAYFKF